MHTPHRLHLYRYQFEPCTISRFHLLFRSSHSESIIRTVTVLFLVVTIRRYNTAYTTTLFLVPTPTARCTELGMSPLPEWLKGDLQSGTRVWNLEFLKNRGVQDADATELDVGVRTQG